MFEAVDFTGEIGGLLALAFAMGAGAGWGFAQRTAVKLANTRITELKDDLHKALGRIEKLEDERYRDARADAGKIDADSDLARLAARLENKP